MTRAICCLILGTMMGACGYYYRPANSSKQVAEYQIPEQAPRGQVRLRSAGIVQMPAAASEKGPALHVVMTVVNNGAHPWRVDTQKALLASPQGEMAPALAASATGSAVSIVEVPVGQTRAISLYYGLPHPAKRVDVRWEVETGQGLVRGDTPFRRAEMGTTTPCGAYASAYCISGYAS
jgi:hypothetical protein